MIFATRVLQLVQPSGNIDIPVRVFAPEERSTDEWACTFEIDWPEGKNARTQFGVDAVQALELALKIVGVTIYTSDHHQSGNLMWLEPGQGYGFPVSENARDLLVGEDKGW